MPAGDVNRAVIAQGIELAVALMGDYMSKDSPGVFELLMPEYVDTLDGPEDAARALMLVSIAHGLVALLALAVEGEQEALEDLERRLIEAQWGAAQRDEGDEGETES
jgi:hypothetical protein